LSDAAAFADWLAPLRQCEWVVYAKRPFAGPQAVLAYLSRYTHRVAISNRRLLACDDRGVTFRWKDYRAHGRTRYKTMTLNTAEFMRRFLLHVLPSGFHRIRHYGLLANANRKNHIATARELLHQPAPVLPAVPSEAHTASAALQPHLRVPALRGADDHHRDLRPRTADPRAARLECSTVSARRSPRSTPPPARHRSVPTQRAFAWHRAQHPHCHDQRQQMLCLPTAAAHESTISADYANLIVPSRRTASTQIPIAPRPA